MKKLFQGGQVFNGSEFLRPGTGVMIDDATIIAVAPLDEFASFDGPVIDTTGQTLLPGLIDCHVHIGSTANPEFAKAILSTPLDELAGHALLMAQDSLRGGITALRDLGSVEYVDLKLRDRISAGLEFGPELVCSGKSITVTGGHMYQLSLEVDDATAAIEATRANINAGADVIKLIATGGVATPNVDPLKAMMSVEEVQAITRTAHDAGLKVAAHAQGAPGIQIALDAGVESIEHGFQLTETLIAQMLEQGTYLVPTLSAINATLENAHLGIPEFMLDKARYFRDMQARSFQDFVAAGGRVAMGTDAGTPRNYHGANGHELQLMVDLGMSITAALNAATENAATLIDRPTLGCIKSGSVADLLLVRGDASQSIHCVAERGEHVAVYKNGISVYDRLGQTREPGVPYIEGDSPF